MKILLSLLVVSLVIILIPQVMATHIGGCPHEDLECIATAFEADEPTFTTGTVSIPETFQGTNSNSESRSSLSWLEWKIVYQDGIETGTTQFVTTSFTGFPLSFVSESQTFRTLIVTEVRGIQSFTGIGDSFCHTLPSQTYNVKTLVNGAEVNIAKQLFGSNEFNQNTAINKGFGVKFTPSLVEQLLENKGIILKSGDVITWEVTSNNRYTLFRGEVTGQVCDAIRGEAFDGSAVGMSFKQNFVFLDPIDQITRPTTSEPDLDGDGIPDSVDQCDFSPERYNGFQDEDGCPDLDPISFDPTSILDQDGDGILDADDLCINSPENFNGVEDGDGCPDGSILDVNFGAIAITQPIEPLVQVEPVISSLPTFTEIVGGSVAVEDIELIEDNPMTMVHVEESISDQPILTEGTSLTCDYSIQDCDEVFFQAVRNFEATTGIMIPFELSLVNIILIVAVIAGAIFIIMKVLRKKR